MKRQLVTSKPVVMNITELRPFDDKNYMLNTSMKGTAVHPYLTLNDGKGQYAGQGQFLVRVDYLKGQARRLGIVSVLDYVALVNADQTNVFEFDVERKVVGEKLDNDDNSPVLNANGEQVTYKGDARTKDEGAEYFGIINTNITLSDAIHEKLLNTTMSSIMQGRNTNANDSTLIVRPRRVLPAISSNVDSNEHDPLQGWKAPVRKRNQSQTDYDEAVQLSKDAWLAEHEPA